MIIFPSVVGDATIPGGWTSNTTLVAVGNKVFLLGTNCSPASPCTRDATQAGHVFATVPSGSVCAANNTAFTALAYDRQGTVFNGDVIVTCFNGTRFEAWRLNFTTGFAATPFKIFTAGVFSGRHGFAPYNFGTKNGKLLDGRLLVYREDTRQLLAIDNLGDSEPICSPAANPCIVNAMPNNQGRGSVKAIPVLYPFNDTDGLFATVPPRDQILGYLATLFPFAGDVVIVTAKGLMVRVVATSFQSLVVSGTGNLTGNRYLEDQDWSPRGRVQIRVQQPAYNSNPNQGVNGQIVGYLCDGTDADGTGWDPVTQADRDTLRFGRTGSEDSIIKFSNSNTNACGGPLPDLKFFADPAFANCDAPAVCILTGFTDDPEGFEAP